jgi:3-oxoacyl-[acyl-carrier-protein] synthase-3
MLGIQEIGVYIPESRVSNYDRKDKFDIDDNFIEKKIGVKSISLKKKSEKSSHLCVKAFYNLEEKLKIDRTLVDCCVVVTQNPDYNIPHTSAIVHGELELSQSCASFDISLGCSGYVYGLSNIISFMEFNNLQHGLLFTADPYSEIVDTEDKNTALLFGDGATVTYITKSGLWRPFKFSFGTDGSNYRELINRDKLYMNGRSVFNFTATVIPKLIKTFLSELQINDESIDKYVLHQGSRYIVDTIRKRIGTSTDKIPFDMFDYGNTISSSIPIILEKELGKDVNKRIVIAGFGVGLSWGVAILEKMEIRDD